MGPTGSPKRHRCGAGREAVQDPPPQARGGPCKGEEKGRDEDDLRGVLVQGWGGGAPLGEGRGDERKGGGPGSGLRTRQQAHPEDRCAQQWRDCP